MQTTKQMKNKGYSLIEILLVMAIIGILASTLVVAINPSRQLAKARDAQRETDIIAIISTVQQYSAENSGSLPDTDGDQETSNFPTVETCIGTEAPCFDLAGAGDDEIIVPDYLAELPVDPSTGTQENTGYMIFVDENDHISVSATPETKESISVTR